MQTNAFQEIDRIVAALATQVAPIVKVIEAKPATTKDHYADYMTAIDTLARIESDPPKQIICLAVGKAMLNAGGNASGIRWALKLLGHL